MKPALREEGAPPRVAVFDLDVTLTRYDTFLPFVTGYRDQRPRGWPRVALRSVRLLAFWRWRQRSWVKERVLQAFMGGAKRARVEDWADTFTARLCEDALRDHGLRRLREHQDAGDRVILASASFDVYVQRIAELLGIDEVLASRVDWGDNGRLRGIDGANCRDHEKLRRVRALLGDPADGAGVTVYSDSHADLPLLSWAEVGVAVWPSRRLVHQVAGLGLEVQRW